MKISYVMEKTKKILASTIATGALILQGAPSNAQTGPSGVISTEAIRPFKVNVPQADIDDLRHRVLATKWPDRETVSDESQGVRLATIKKLASYWASSETVSRSGHFVASTR